MDAEPPARPLRVLTVARDAGSTDGGAEVLIQEVVKRLSRERFQPYLCVTHAPEPAYRELVEREMAELRATGVNVLELGRESSRELRPWGRLLRLMREERVDIVHAHMPRASVPSTVLARLARVPIFIAHEHGSVLEGRSVRTFLHRNVVGRTADVILAVSDWDRRNLVENERMPASRIRVLRNGITPAVPAGDWDGEGALTPPDARVIGAVGRLYAVKGYDDLLRAMARLHERAADVHCVIVGEGPERQRLQALIEELGLQACVRLVGFREDARDLLRRFDVAVMPSHSEGAPLAMMEYMAAEVPIVATRVGGIPEMVREGRDALLVDACAPEDLAAAIGRLLDDRGLAGRLAASAAARQRAEYDLSVTVARLEALYLELWEQRGSRRAQRPAVVSASVS